MTHHYHIPGPPLGSFIAGFTYYRDYRPQHTIDRYLPNGNIEIIIDLTTNTRYIYDNITLSALQGYKKIWISGIRDKFITIPSGLDAEMFIIEFRKGMSYPFVGRPFTEITGQVVDGTLLLDPVFTELREELVAQAVPAAMFAAAEKMLLKRFRPALAVNPFVDFAVGRILASPSSVTIGAIAAKTGYSNRQFIKIFAENVGVAPKAFLRIIRFQQAVAAMQSAGRVNWASLALGCGYYDQAHFINDFREFSGFTPAAYMKKNDGEFINYVAVG